MAVQKSKKSRSKRDMRRAHDSISAPQLSVEAGSKETHIRHHVSPNGFYRGKNLNLKPAPEAEE